VCCFVVWGPVESGYGGFRKDGGVVNAFCQRWREAEFFVLVLCCQGGLRFVDRLGGEERDVGFFWGRVSLSRGKPVTRGFQLGESKASLKEAPASRGCSSLKQL